MSARQNRRHREEITVISWRNIPAQGVATSSGGKQTAVLSDRFQDAIDRAAAVAGLTDDDAYVGEWSRQAFPLPEEANKAVQSLADELEAGYDEDRLNALVRNGGRDPLDRGPN